MSARASQLKRQAPSDTRGQLRLVRRRKDRRLIKRSAQRRIAPMVVLLLIMFAATVFTVVLEQVMLAQSGFQMSRLRQEITEAETRYGELVLTAAKLGSSERIERVAMERLGMVYPEQVQYIVADVGAKHARSRLARRPQEPLLQNVGEGAAAALEATP